MTKPDPRTEARDKIAGVLSRPIDDITETANAIIRGLIADGWKPPTTKTPRSIAELLGPRRPPEPPNGDYLAARAALKGSA